MNSRKYRRTGGTLYQRGSGLGSVFGRIASMGLRKLAPVLTKTVRRHGKRALKSVAKAGIKSLARSSRRRRSGGGNKKSSGLGNFLVETAAAAVRGRRKDRRRRRNGAAPKRGQGAAAVSTKTHRRRRQRRGRRPDIFTKQTF